MSRPITVALAGTGGYGGYYVNVLLEFVNEGRLAFAGAIDPWPERSGMLPVLESEQIPVFNSLESFYSKSSADLLIVSTPIHLHCAHTCYGLEHGSHVLCEKPVSATIEQARHMLETQKRTGKIVAVGYQWSFSEAVLNLKSDISRGIFGKPVRLKSLVLWPRSEGYFNRNCWAGKIRTAGGAPVFDSPANNAASHFLHNMFFVLGGSITTSAMPVKMVAEVYRANDIENFDSAAMRSYTDDGVEILFITSHATGDNVGPIFDFEFERGAVKCEGSDMDIVAEFADGTEKNYGSPNIKPEMKILTTIDAITTSTNVPCGIEAAIPQTLCINGIQDSVGVITTFASEMITANKKGGENFRVVDGLDDALVKCYDEWKLPFECGIFGWAKPGFEVPAPDN